MSPTPSGLRIDEVGDAFEAAWRRADAPSSRPRIEDHLGTVEPSDRGRLLYELLLVELELRRDRGERPTSGEYRRRFPEHGSVVDRAFGAEALSEATMADGCPAGGGDEVGGRLADYELLAVLGQGGMGVVYKARQCAADRVVALKVIRRDRLDGLAPADRARWLVRFRTEARAAAGLEHDHIVPVHDVGEWEGRPFYSMRLVEGRTLADICRDGPVPARQAATYLVQAARAVAHAHAHDVLHRDLKPRNMLVDAAGRAYVADFGLAKSLDSGPGWTETGDFLGTPSYVAPEQARSAARAGVASDVYGLGATLYDLLTGRPPFLAATVAETLNQVLHDDPVPPRRLNPAIPRDLETIALACLHKEPARRYRSAAALADDLDRYLHGEPIRARPVGGAERAWLWARRRPAVALLLGLLLLAVAVGATGVGWQWRHAEAARREEAVQRRQAETTLHFSRITQARLEWLNGDVARAERLLDLCRPAPGQPDQRGWEWYHLHRLCHSDLETLRGHGHWAYAVAFSPDGRLLASARADPYREKVVGTVTVHDVTGEAAREVRTFRGQDAGFLDLAFSPDGRLLAAAENDLTLYGPGTVRVWELVTGKELLALRGHPEVIWGVAFSPDGGRLATCGVEGSVHIWDIKGRLLLTVPGHARHAFAAAFSPDGRLLASVGGDDTVRVWDAVTGNLRHTLRHQGNEAVTGRLAFSADGARLAATLSGAGVEVWDTRTWAAQTLRGHTGTVNGLAFRPDGKALVTGSDDHTVRVWDLAKGVAVNVLRGHTSGVLHVAFHPDGRRVASGSKDQTVRLWDAARPQQGLTLAGHNRNILALVVRPDGRLVSVAADGTAKTWDATTGALLADWPLDVCRFEWPRTDAVFNRDGTRLAAVSGTDGRVVKVWDVDAGRELTTLTHPRLAVTAVALSADGRRLATAAAEGWKPGGPAEVTLWDLDGGRELLRFPAHAQAVTCLAFDPEGRRLATASFDGTATVWDALSGRALRVLRGHQSAIAGLAFAPDGRLLATAGYSDETVRLWDWGSGEERFVLPCPIQLQSVSFSPDGRRVSGGSVDLVQLWDTGSGQETFSLRLRPRAADLTHRVHPVFDPEGRLLAATNADHTISVWDSTDPEAPP